MGIFDDFSKFLEDRLDEYLAANPHLELMAMEEKLREQEEETLKLMTDLKLRERQLQDEILALAQEIQVWHARIEKAEAKGRLDLAEPAKEHEASLLRQGNQKWGQMEMLKEQIQQTHELQQKIQQRRKELQAQVTQAQTSRTATQIPNPGWSQPTPNPNAPSPAQLEKQFQRWEAEEELEQLKRNLGK
ncbi:hypothetical protein OsccyDRAFT_2600 [Leptolyngbyaceae cyanobacterium JSC-12]|nr:hypothetical protein OsccyDRAFT_2600 [Leptolyngbyaceae cyanobacterium JSC-12]